MAKDYVFAEFTIDLDRCVLLRDGIEVPLRPKTFDLLHYLVQHPGKLITRKRLMTAVWPDVVVTVFVVRAEVVASIDPGLPVGTVFDNCYHFYEDGTWFDPLYPGLGIAVPGIWVQHADRPKIAYTATVANQLETPDLLLIQNGTVTPGPAQGKKTQVVAYTTGFAIDEGEVPLVEVKSVGVGMDTCPFF